MDKTPEAVLQKFWGYPGFRGSQARIIETIVNGRDVIALLPTGGGKSLCYQVPGLLQPGLCIVVSPLLALMEDQVTDLNARGIRALSLSGRLSKQDVTRLLDNVEFGKYKFLYLSPERLQQEVVLERLKSLSVNLIAIDEAHCISQWGFDFRPAYLHCSVLRDLHPDIPVIALTATGTTEVLGDIERLLTLEEPAIYRDSVYRANIAYRVLPAEDKKFRLQRLLHRTPGTAIVYVATRRATAVVSKFLKAKGITAGAYHGGLSASDKSREFKSWKSGKTRVMVATNAFGMGIDKSNVRLVVHLDIPETLEHYFQEAGRAGRDGDPALATLIMGPADLKRASEYFLGNLPTVKDLLLVYKKLNSYFKIAYGERIEEYYPLNFAAFCNTYSLPIPLAFNALEILDRQGVISLSQQFWQKSMIRFVCSKSTLWDYLKTYPMFQGTIQTLLRTYGGIFDFETPINLTSVARKSGIPESALLDQVRQLEKDGIIHLKIAEGDLQIRFLVPREDEKTIYAFAKEVEQRLKIKKKKVGEMAAYLQNDNRCRQLQLLSYFGEKLKKPCGVCDVCMPEASIEEKPLGMLRKKILDSLNEGPKTSRELLEDSDLPENQTLYCLQKLLYDGTLLLGAENKYRIA
jgi:ATP-dependent DNA helicase RecQ